MKIKHFRRIRELSHILSTIPSSPRKTVRGPSEIENKTPDELHLFEKKAELKILAIFNKHSSLLILKILVL